VIWFSAFVISVAGTAVNVGMYFWAHSPVSIAAAVFCGLFAIGNLVMMTRE
jgi:hypothetical protein